MIAPNHPSTPLLKIPINTAKIPSTNDATPIFSSSLCFSFFDFKSYFHYIVDYFACQVEFFQFFKYDPIHSVISCLSLAKNLVSLISRKPDSFYTNIYFRYFSTLLYSQIQICIDNISYITVSSSIFTD